MKSPWTIRIKVRGETARAVFVDVLSNLTNGRNALNVCLPKSQISMDDCRTVAALPGWLMRDRDLYRFGHKGDTTEDTTPVTRDPRGPGCEYCDGEGVGCPGVGDGQDQREVLPVGDRNRR